MTDANLPDRLQTTTLNATIASTIQPSLDVAWPQGLIAFFPLNSVAGDAVVSREGVRTFSASRVSGTAAVDAADPGPFGPSLVLDGATCYVVGGIEPSPSAIGSLDVSRTGDQVTVIAWVKDTAPTWSLMGMRAGSHIESDTRTARQYALYYGGSGYGGRRRLSPHIGAQDGPTPGYPWNVDFAASARPYSGGWHMEAFTYDGEKIIAYVDGTADDYPTFTDPAPNSGYTVQRTYAKNPLVMKRGINRSATKKAFSIGAALHGGAPYTPTNFTYGRMSGLAVFNRALTSDEIMKIRLATIQPATPILTWDFYWDDVTGPLSASTTGWKSIATAAASDVSADGSATHYRLSAPTTATMHLTRNTGVGPGLAYFPITGLRSTQVRKVSFDLNSALVGPAQRVAVKVGGQWLASDSTFHVNSDHASASDWSTAEARELLIDHSAAKWRVLDYQAPTEKTVTRRNGCTNPSAEVDSTGVSSTQYAGPGGVNVFGSSNWGNAYAGVNSWRMRWTTSPTTLGAAVVHTGLEAPTVGTTYTWASHSKATFDHTFAQKISFYDAGAALISSFTGTEVRPAVNAWGRSSVSATVPAGTATARTEVVQLNRATNVLPNTTTDYWFVDGWSQEEGPLGTYFDGNTATAAWTGAAGLSASTMAGTRFEGVLALGAVLSADAVPGPLEAIGFYSEGTAGAARIRNVKLS